MTSENSAKRKAYPLFTPPALCLFSRRVRAWWNGRHRRLKISRPQGRAGSNPAAGTTLLANSLVSLHILTYTRSVDHVGDHSAPIHLRQRRDILLQPSNS